MSMEKFVDKTTKLTKAQPVKIWTELYAKGFKVGIEFNFNPYDPHDMDQIIKRDSDLRKSLQEFIKMYQEESESKLIKDA